MSAAMSSPLSCSAKWPVEQVQFRVGQIAQVRTRAVGRKKHAILSPDDESRWRRERKNAWNCGYYRPRARSKSEPEGPT